VFICHATGNGGFNLINVNANACPAHMRHQGGRDFVCPNPAQ
jgi:hypothetical protein